MLLRILCPTTTYVEMQAPEYMTLCDFKVLVELQTGYPADELNLIFEGALLKENDKTLAEYKLKDGSTLQMMHSLSSIEDFDDFEVSDDDSSSDSLRNYSLADAENVDVKDEGAEGTTNVGIQLCKNIFTLNN